MNEFFHKKIPVSRSVGELKEFLEKYRGFKFCLYLGYKDEEGWNKSTSRVYMNQVFGNLLYVPVSIVKGDYASLREIYGIAKDNDDIVAINQTQPHKSNPVLKESFAGEKLPANVDALVKGADKKFRLFDLNGPSFAGWFREEVDILEGKAILIFGVGGVGEPIARALVREKPTELILVDLAPKQDLAAELSQLVRVAFFADLSRIDFGGRPAVFINCAGKEGADDSGVLDLLERYRGRNHIFVDLRPYLEIDTVSRARDLGWRSYTGHGMNARNDYTLLVKIAEIIRETPPGFQNFKELVARAS